MSKKVRRPDSDHSRSEELLSQHVLLLRDKSKNGIEDGMHVACDPSCPDQSKQTREVVAGKNVTLVDIRIQNTLRRDSETADWPDNYVVGYGRGCMRFILVCQRPKMRHFWIYSI